MGHFGENGQNGLWPGKGARTRQGTGEAEGGRGGTPRTPLVSTSKLVQNNRQRSPLPVYCTACGACCGGGFEGEGIPPPRASLLASFVPCLVPLLVSYSLSWKVPDSCSFRAKTCSRMLSKSTGFLRSKISEISA